MASLSAYQTTKTALQKLWHYPQKWWVMAFLSIPVFLSNTHSFLPAPFGEMIALIGVALSFVIYILSAIAIIHYMSDGYQFDGIKGFLIPKQPFFKISIKTFAVFVGCFVVGFALSAILWFIHPYLIVLSLGLYCYLMPKLCLVLPFFVKNQNKGLMDSLYFTDGAYWYLTRILGFTFLASVVLIIILIPIAWILSFIVGSIAIIAATLLIQVIASMITLSIYAQAYQIIAADENKT